MNPPRFRITVTRMMILIACVAIGLAAFRVHLSLGSFVSAIVILGVWRMFEIGDMCRDGGVPLSVLQWMMTLISSLVVAALIVNLSAFFALSAYMILMVCFVMSMNSHGHARLSPEHMLVILAASGSGGYAANKIRPELWPSRWASFRLRDQATSATVTVDSSVDLDL